MNTEEQLAIRERLAGAQGWKKDSVRDSIWVKPPYSRTLPDPFSSASDLLELEIWVQGQKSWFCSYTVTDSEVFITAWNFHVSAKGQFQEALTLVFYRALLEVEQNGK